MYNDVRNHRIYAYLNAKEMDAFLEAMRVKDMAHQATFARHMIVEGSQQIIVNSRKFSQKKPIKTTVSYQLPHGGFTVVNPTNPTKH